MVVVGCRTDTSPGKVVMVSLGNREPVEVGALTLTNATSLYAAVIDTVNLYAYFGFVYRIDRALILMTIIGVLVLISYCR